MKIKFIGAARIVTGSCYLFTVKDYQFLLECGMFQGEKEETKLNYDPFPFEPARIKFVILSHAHIDHTGLIPKLVRDGFKGTIYCTKPTKDLCDIMLQDSGHLQESENYTENKKRMRQGLPLRNTLYTQKDAIACMKNFKGYDYDEEIKITPEVTIVYRDAGHILGSAIIELYIKEEKTTKIVFSGDLGQKDTPIVRDPTFIKDADYVMMETTYGDRIHEKAEERKQKLQAILSKTLKRGGKVIIPSFAIERTQELLYHMNYLVEHGLIPKTNLFLDSPLAIDATDIFLKYPQYYDKETLALFKKGDSPFRFPGLRYTKKTEESKELNEYDKPCIIVAGAGMCNGGRIKHHLKHNVWNAKNTILFIGDQAKGTLGRQILEHAEFIRIYGEEYKVAAEIEKINAYSAHADQNGLLEWVRYFNKPKKVFLVHGEEKPIEVFSELVRKETGYETYAPVRGEEITL